ncbi:hypothetical protein WR25_03100 [Diploscapter pachys]|uniref:Uncharacterized protein n=1 Tax=Diploscapter pachys TaxID=2018661 RepID=A0A2A2L5U2_9BILA|nr:hypothetical protein WR25_03100 [Diploscapter pachys]
MGKNVFIFSHLTLNDNAKDANCNNIFSYFPNLGKRLNASEAKRLNEIDEYREKKPGENHLMGYKENTQNPSCPIPPTAFIMTTSIVIAAIIVVLLICWVSSSKHHLAASVA